MAVTIEVTSGRRRVLGKGAPWEAWAIVVSEGSPADAMVPFGGWGSTRHAAEQMALAALRRDQSAAQAGYSDMRTRTLSM